MPKKKTAPTRLQTSKKRKTAARKSAPKSRVKRSKTGKALICANDEQCFWTTDGKILSNLVELENSLEHMADEVFAHHVTKDKNDFANWVGSVLADKELEKALRRAKKPKTAHTIVLRRLKVYDI